ncbi:hypothetical protein D3C74_353590 [compost metagenome]
MRQALLTERRYLIGQQLKALVLLLNRSAQCQQRALRNMPCAAAPYFGEQHYLTALDLILKLHEGHRFSLLGRNRFNRYYHACNNRFALIRRLGKIHQPIDLIAAKQALKIVERMARQI